MIPYGIRSYHFLMYNHVHCMMILLEIQSILNDFVSSISGIGLIALGTIPYSVLTYTICIE